MTEKRLSNEGDERAVTGSFAVSVNCGRSLCYYQGMVRLNVVAASLAGLLIVFASVSSCALSGAGEIDLSGCTRTCNEENTSCLDAADPCIDDMEECFDDANECSKSCDECEDSGACTEDQTDECNRECRDEANACTDLIGKCLELKEGCLDLLVECVAACIEDTEDKLK